MLAFEHRMLWLYRHRSEVGGAASLYRYGTLLIRFAGFRSKCERHHHYRERAITLHLCVATERGPDP